MYFYEDGEPTDPKDEELMSGTGDGGDDEEDDDDDDDTSDGGDDGDIGEELDDDGDGDSDDGDSRSKKHKDKDKPEQKEKPEDQLDRDGLREQLQNKSNEMDGKGRSDSPSDGVGGEKGKGKGKGESGGDGKPGGDGARPDVAKNAEQAGQNAGKQAAEEGAKQAATQGAPAAANAGASAAEAGAGAAGTGASAGAAGAGAAGAGAGAGAAGAGASGAAGGAAVAATPVGWVIGVIVAIIVLIIIIVGVVMFFVAVPGQIVGKIRSLASSVFKAWAAMIEGEDVQVTTTQMANVANYIEGMGYDLKGEGFVSYDKKKEDITQDRTVDGETVKSTITNLTDLTQKGYDDSSDLKDKSREELEALLYLDEKQGVIRRNDNQDVVDLNSEPILAYIISDNQCNMIRNFNTTLDAQSGGNGNLISDIIVGIAAVFGAIVMFLTPVGWILSLVAGIVAAAAVLGGSYLLVTMNSNPVYGRGLITLYHEDGVVGKRGGYYEKSEKGYIALDAQTKKLMVKKGWSNGTYTFDVDGWSGRYGMPLEFLLSVHLATQMPDLAIDMASQFQTEVEVLLHEIEGGEVSAGILKSGHMPNGDEDFIVYNTIAEMGKDEASFWDKLCEGALDFINGAADLITGDTIWTEEELEKLNLTDRVLCKLFEMGMPHAMDDDPSTVACSIGGDCKDSHAENQCSCCSHIPGSHHKSETEACTDSTELYDSDGDIANDHYICPACATRAGKVTLALQVSNDRDWESYTPYISKVTDHWFRDVYFVFNMDDSFEAEAFNKVIQVDEDYFYKTNERWTLYEIWEEGDDIPIDPNSNNNFQVGDYKLYETYETEKEFSRIVNGAEEHYTAKVRETKSEPSRKTKDEVQAINELIALQNEDSEEYQKELEKRGLQESDVVRLVKKPINDKLTANQGSDWSAYAPADESGDAIPWTKMEVGENGKEELKANALYDDYDASTPDDIRIYYKETRPGDIKQVEDGQRTETNPKIKTMFIENQYYKYDGNVQTANKIIEDKSRADNKAEYYQTENDARDKSLIAKPNVNKDSLTAFSILENTHTLDADFIYRDFKELIVELNYFDKEDLSDKLEDVMQWPIPECGSAGWPVRRYEKGETYYGTLINSKVDLDYMTELDVKRAEAELDKLEDEVQAEPVTQGLNGLQSNNVQTSTTGSLQTSGQLAANGGLVGAGEPPNISVDQFVQTGYDVHKIMEEGGGWDYCVNNGTGCTHKYGHSCGLDATIQEAEANHHNTCCATFTSWVLKEAGFDLSDHPGMHGAKSSYDWCKANNWTAITDLSAMEPGDFLFNKHDYSGTDTNMIGHVQMLGNDGEWLNAGSVDAINDKPKAYDPKFIIGMRPNLNGSGQPFEGYEPEQAVVSPLTGKVVDYGKVTRKNEETGEDEEVDYIKIQAIDHYITSDKGEKVRRECTSDSEDCTWEEKSKDTKEGYDYFYEEYQGVIDGCVLYMEGFDLTIEETLANGDLESEDVTQYKSNTVYNMTNNLKEAQSLWMEDAKAGALPYINDGVDKDGKPCIYIKEGTVIGKTRKDPDGFPPEIEVDEEGVPLSTNPAGCGNYIRLILRDLEDSIIEDVETYIKIDKLNNLSQTQPYQAQPGDLELLANLLHHEGCEAYFANRAVFAGKPELARDASRVTGYVLLNRAILNYGGHGTTIREQILAPGQYSTAYDVTESTADYCDLCLANAEWCLTYDCNSVVSPQTNTPMPRNVLGQSGWCQTCKPKFSCWWWVDTNNNGQHDEYSGEGSWFDTFYCVNDAFPAE